ncbi:uncharacterized protein [Antedon mediterranea]|uniref:uncharacterized protein isoform X1 n=1 Tax=Antedon mediterranea TaxID=105859 RepID=UPI003AF92510
MLTLLQHMPTDPCKITLEQTITCNSCGNVSTTIDQSNHYVLRLNDTQTMHTALLNSLTKPHSIYFLCTACTFNKALQTKVIHTAPSVLIILLQIDHSPGLKSDVSGLTSNTLSLPTVTGSDVQYLLQSTLAPLGMTTSSRHYTSCIRNNKTGACIESDDDKLVSVPTMSGQPAYIAVYTLDTHKPVQDQAHQPIEPVEQNKEKLLKRRKMKSVVTQHSIVSNSPSSEMDIISNLPKTSDNVAYNKRTNNETLSDLLTMDSTVANTNNITSQSVVRSSEEQDTAPDTNKTCRQGNESDQLTSKGQSRPTKSISKDPENADITVLRKSVSATNIPVDNHQTTNLETQLNTDAKIQEQTFTQSVVTKKFFRQQVMKFIRSHNADVTYKETLKHYIGLTVSSFCRWKALVKKELDVCTLKQNVLQWLQQNKDDASFQNTCQQFPDLKIHKSTLTKWKQQAKALKNTHVVSSKDATKNITSQSVARSSKEQDIM